MTMSRADIERDVLFTRRHFCTEEYVSVVSSEVIDAKCAELIPDFEVMARHAQPLRPGETGIVTLMRRKTAALLADRVWGADTEVDTGISFGWELPMEIRFRAALKFHALFVRSALAPKVQPASRSDLEGFIAEVERDFAHGFAVADGARVVPLYDLAARRDFQYQGGDQTAIVAIVENLNVVDEDQLSWEQVVGFRRDADALAAYRRFVHWLDREMIGRSIQYVSDEIGHRLEQYQWSLRKHGIQTVVGTLENTLNPQSLLASSATGIAVDVIAGKPIWSLLAGGGLLLGRAALSLATTLVERRDIEMGHRDIAYVQQLKRVADQA